MSVKAFEFVSVIGLQQLGEKAQTKVMMDQSMAVGCQKRC